MSFDKLLSQHINHFEKVIEHNLPHDDHNLSHAMRYSMLQKGKRLRPLIVYLTGKSLGANQDSLDIPAFAIECIHTYSLIHDDLPAMDNDDTRRGQPSCHKAFSESTAILAGDTLLTSAFEILSQKTTVLTPSQQIEMVHILAYASGATGLTLGQFFDLNLSMDRSIETLEMIYSKKTSTLFIAAVQLGIIAAKNNDPNIMHLLTQFANALGIAFQIKDDLNDIGKEPETTISYPSLVGINKAIEKYHFFKSKALGFLNSIDLNQSDLASFLLHILPD